MHVPDQSWSCHQHMSWAEARVRTTTGSCPRLEPELLLICSLVWDLSQNHQMPLEGATLCPAVWIQSGTKAEFDIPALDQATLDACDRPQQSWILFLALGNNSCYLVPQSLSV